MISQFSIIVQWQVQSSILPYKGRKLCLGKSVKKKSYVFPGNGKNLILTVIFIALPLSN